MNKLKSNLFTKRTEAHFLQPSQYVKFFIKKIFENKKNWLSNLIRKTTGHISKNVYLTNKGKMSLEAKTIRLMYALNWSSGKRFFRKT